jgi:hypothetical protein
MGLKFCIFARSINPVGTRFNTVGINGDRPEVGLDPRTDGVAHPSVVHSERPDPIRSRCHYKWILGLWGLKAGAKPECASGEARGRGRLGAVIARQHDFNVHYTCPYCGRAAAELMPQNACQVLYDCKRCGARLKPKPGDCCVFCSYGSVPCPPIQRAKAAR